MRVTTSFCGLVLVGVLSGCTGDDSTTLDFGTATSQTSTIVWSTATTTSIAPTSTTVASTTTTSGSTTTIAVAPTEPPSPTTVTETTTVPDESATVPPPPPTPEEQVAADYLAARNAREACSFEPTTCDVAATSVAGSPNEDNVRTTVQDLLDQNVRAIPGHGEVKIKIESVTIAGDMATLVACNLDSVVLYNIGDPANPDDDVVVNDEVVSYRVSWEMRLIGSRWLPFEGTNLERGVSGSDICGLS